MLLTNLGVNHCKSIIGFVLLKAAASLAKDLDICKTLQDNGAFDGHHHQFKYPDQSRVEPFLPLLQSTITLVF